ncbi:uncharacterized protein PV06_11514 [Exophiala oligosperma]|uniref:RNase H type-1 domain-containing protein n=1 Tax=Exophiala oligosperma TaxID=215243 RepID=A0A0D2DKB5_9EURO|nr:uncharacterized protein PV06_11514 [Exophiala oligosperma]KIW36184.1 hypothetical protein PV06_11514 [Exophiala oligosperma]
MVKVLMQLRRLRGLSPATARLLFTCTVAPVVDYASNVWMHVYKDHSSDPSTEKQHRSPLYQVADALQDVLMEELETIRPCPIPPWEERILKVVDASAARHPDTVQAVHIAVSSSARNGVVGIEQNPYSGELAAVGTALGTLPELRFCSVMLTTRNKAEALALQKPRQQSGQQYIRRIYKSVRALRRYGNTVAVCWLPSSEEHELMKLAKEKAKAVKRQGCTPQDATP